jgi:hypothetical protein
MRLATKFLISVALLSGAVPAYANPECGNPCSGFLQGAAPSFVDGTACQVKKVIVLTKDAADCGKIGGKVAKAAQ